MHVQDMMKSHKNLWLFASLLMFTACTQLLKIEQKDEEGNVFERYSVHKETNQKEGLYERFYADGTVEEEATYIHDTLDGPRKLFHPNGQLAIIENYSMGQFVGAYESFYEDGAPEITGQYLENVMDGVWKNFYPDGQVAAVTTFADNQENGPFEEYYRNGKMAAKGTYLEGEFEQGVLELFAEDGSLQKKMECQRGICRTVWTAEEGDIQMTSDSLFQKIQEISSQNIE